MLPNRFCGKSGRRTDKQTTTLLLQLEREVHRFADQLEFGLFHHACETEGERWQTNQSAETLLSCGSRNTHFSHQRDLVCIALDFFLPVNHTNTMSFFNFISVSCIWEQFLILRWLHMSIRTELLLTQWYMKRIMISGLYVLFQLFPLPGSNGLTYLCVTKIAKDL